MECIIYLADGCNMECSYCYEGDTKKPKLMSRDTLVNALMFIVDNRKSDDEVVSLVFLGGEPLLNKKLLFEAMSLIDEKYGSIKKYFRYSITTNATMLDDEVLDLFLKHQFTISISVDGDEKTHNINRKSKDGNNLYPIIYGNLLKMIQKKMAFNVRMTVTTNNVQYFLQNIKYFIEMGVYRIYAAFDSFADWNDKSLSILDEQLGLIDTYYLNEIEPVENYILNFYDLKFPTFIAKRNAKYCSAGSKSHFTITSQGEVYPCGYVANRENQKWILGNLRNGVDFARFPPLVKENISEISKCKDCNIQFTCKGAKCGFQNYIETGFLNRPLDIICRIERILCKHDYYVIRELYKKSSPRLLDNIELAKQYNVEFSKIMLEIMDSEDRNNKCK